MAEKRLTRIPVLDTHNDHETFIPVGIVEGKHSGPTLGVIGGVHGTEFASHEGVARFWDSLEPSEISGNVLVVLMADVTAMLYHSLYTNPIDGKNLNRVWPGIQDGTLSEVIAYTITQEIVLKSDAVIDCHGGEFDEAIDLFVFTHTVGDEVLDKKAIDLAMSLGMPFVEVTDARGPVLGTGTGSGEAMLSGRPSISLECGGRGESTERHVAATFYSLRNALIHMGIVQGQPIIWEGYPVKLDHGILLKTTAGGLYVPEVEVGSWVDKDAVFARILDFDNSVIEEICAPESGIVLDVINARGIKAGGFAGKIGVI